MASGHYLFLPGPFTLFFTPNAADQSKYNRTAVKSFVCRGAGFQISTDGVFLAIHQDGSNGWPLLYVGQQHGLKSRLSEWMRNCHPPRYLKKSQANCLRHFP